jgi:hypothetical protein
MVCIIILFLVFVLISEMSGECSLAAYHAPLIFEL